MKRVAVKQTVAILLTLCMLMSLALPLSAAEGWSPSVGNADTGDDTCLYVVTDTLQNTDAEILYELRRVVHLLSMEMEATLGHTFFVEYGSLADSESTDILLCLETASEHALGGFSLEINEGRMTLTASDTNGILYGGRMLLTALLTNGFAGEIEQASPAVAERAVTLNISKGSFAAQDLRSVIRELSFSGINALILQISDGESVGIESLKNVSVNAASGAYLTRDEFDALAAYARSYHVSLIPAFCAFGNTGYAADAAAVKALVAEFGSYFAALGSNAFLLTGSRKDVALANELYAVLSQQGYDSVRVENSQVAAGLHAAIGVYVPFNEDPSAAVAGGHAVFNSVVSNNVFGLYQSYSPLSFGDAADAEGSNLILIDGTVNILLLRAYADKLWNTDARTAQEFESFVWAQTYVGAAPSANAEALPDSLDTTELEALIAEFPDVTEHSYTLSSYENYKNVIQEAETYYRGAYLLHYSQDNVDAMCSAIRAAKANLISMDITVPLLNLIMEYSMFYCEEHFWDPYSLESWVPYSTIVRSADQILQGGIYEPYTITLLCMQINTFKAKLVRESEMADQRVNGFLGGNFQTSYVYQGKKARMVINTVRDLNVNVSMVSIFDQHGNVVSLDSTITEAAYNRRQSNLRAYYVDMMMDLAPGNYTFRVYGTVDYMEANGNLSFRYTADYVDCTITVR